MDRLDITSGSVSLTLYLGVGISAILLSTLFVMIRLWNTWVKEKTFRIEEYLSIVTILLLVLALVLRIYVVRAYISMADPESTTPERIISFYLSMEMGQTIIAAFLSFFAKVPLFVLYIRLFGSVKWVRIASYYSIALALLQFIISSSLLGAYCSPIGRYVLDELFINNCTVWYPCVVLWNGIIAVVTDIILFLIPFPIIIKLQLPRQKKIDLAIVFMAGIFGIAIGGISLYWRVITFRNGTIPRYTLMLSTAGECSIAIIISCVPAIPSFWTNHVSNSTLHLRIKSVVASTLLRKRKASSSSYENLRGHTSNVAGNDHCLAGPNDENAIKKSHDIEYGTSETWLTI